MTIPIATAIITVFNEEKYVDLAVRSLLVQSLRDIEILIVDDGSTDRTPVILEQFDDERLRVICAGRLGRAGALAYAARNARGKYVANLDADDEAMPNRLEEQVNFLESHQDHGWVGSAAEREDSQREEHIIRRYAEQDADIRRQAAKCIPYCHSAITFRRELVDRGVNYDENQNYLIDFEYFIRVAKQCKVANLPEVLAKRRVRNESYFQRNFSRRRQKRRMAQLCARAIRDFGLPKYCYAYPLLHLGYPLVPQVVQRQIRAAGGLRETRWKPL